MSRPLEGVRVLDLSRLLPGPVCSMLLRRQGAQSLKVEDCGPGDYLRYLEPIGPSGMGVVFEAVNAGAQSLCLNLKTERGVALLWRLLESSEVLLESFRPGVLARLGFAPEEILERFPGLVVASISAWGAKDERAALAAHDLNIEARIGLTQVEGGHLPLLPWADLLGGGAVAALEIAAALVEVARSGRGQHLDLSMAGGLAQVLDPMMEGLAATGSEPSVLTGDSPAYACYATADGGWVAVATIEAKFWQALCAALERPDLAGRDPLRGEDREDTRQELATLFAGQPTQHWQCRLASLDACVNVAVSPQGRDVLPPPHRVLDAGAPRAGEHTDLVLEGLGLGASELAHLRATGVVS